MLYYPLILPTCMVKGKVLEVGVEETTEGAVVEALLVPEENSNLMGKLCATLGTTKSHAMAPLQQMAVRHSLEKKGFTSVLGSTITNIVEKITRNVSTNLSLGVKIISEMIIKLFKLNNV